MGASSAGGSNTLLHVREDGALVTAVIDAPPITVITMALFEELAALALELKANPTALVFVLKSADPDFFLAHFDVGVLIAMADAPPAPATPPAADANAYHAMCHRFQRMDKITIAQIEGRVGGGGAELAMSFDMRFGVTGKTIINQMEVPIGILSGGTGTQRLPRLVGRARALEIIVGGIDLDAETAEKWGWLRPPPSLNLCFSPATRQPASCGLQIGVVQAAGPCAITRARLGSASADGQSEDKTVQKYNGRFIGAYLHNCRHRWSSHSTIGAASLQGNSGFHN